MQSNEIKKKIESKLTQIQRQIDEKDFEKSRKKELQKSKRAERDTLRSYDQTLARTRTEIETENVNINGELRKEKSEMHRINAELVYKQRHEYEDMIRGYEREMQFNSQTFKRNEEARILREIASLKQGITQLDNYEQKKRVVNSLQESLKVIMDKRDANWSERKSNNNRIHQLNKEITDLAAEISYINEKELTEMNHLKNELKKQLEDLNREIAAKHQQLRKETLQNKMRNKALKQDEVLLSMEETLRDLNKLINYYQKLIDTVSLNDNSSKQRSLKTSTDTSSSSSSLNASNATELFEQLNSSKLLALCLPDTSYYCSEISNSRKNSSNFSTPATSALNTPTCEPVGSFLTRKSFDFEEIRTKKQIKKQKSNKNSKVAHSVEIINLLGKMSVPFHLSSQLEECLKELTTRKNVVLNQINIYESANRASDPNESFELNSLDSNYESDNNSVKSSSNLASKIITSATNELSTSLETSLKIQCETTLDNMNSDDSDVTVNELVHLNENKLSLVPRLLIGSNKINKNKSNSDSSKTSSTSSDSTTTPGSPKTPTPFSTDNCLENEIDLNKTAAQSSEALISKDNLSFMRQLSDGYSSSNTPLSASSINNETPFTNPFFQQLTK